MARPLHQVAKVRITCPTGSCCVCAGHTCCDYTSTLNLFYPEMITLISTQQNYLSVQSIHYKHGIHTKYLEIRYHTKEYTKIYLFFQYRV